MAGKTKSLNFGGKNQKFKFWWENQEVWIFIGKSKILNFVRKSKILNFARKSKILNFVRKFNTLNFVRNSKNLNFGGKIEYFEFWREDLKIWILAGINWSCKCIPQDSLKINKMIPTNFFWKKKLLSRVFPAKIHICPTESVFLPEV